MKDKIHRFFVKHNIIKDTFLCEGMVYFDSGKPSLLPTQYVKWLKKVTVRCFYKQVDKKAIELLNEEYPEYNGFIYIF